MELSTGAALNLQEAGVNGVKFRIGLNLQEPEWMESSSGAALNLQEAGVQGVKFRISS